MEKPRGETVFQVCLSQGRRAQLSDSTVRYSRYINPFWRLHKMKSYFSYFIATRWKWKIRRKIGPAVKIQLFKEKLSKTQPPGSLKEEIALRSVNLPKTIGHLPPPVIIRRKQILVRPTRPEPSRYALGRGFANVFRDEDPESSDSHESSSRSRYRHAETISTPSVRETCSESVERPKWRPLVKSSSSNGTPRVYVESDTTWSSCSYDKDQSFYDKDHSLYDKRSLRHQTSEDSSSRQEAGASAVFIDRISLSSYCLQENDFASEERDILIESTRSTTSLRRSRLTKFGARRTNGSFASLKDHCSSGSSQQLDVAEKSPRRNFSPKVSFESDIVSEGQEEDDFFEDRPGTSTAFTFRKKLATWGREGKDLLVKSVSSANTLAPTTMTCIKSPRAMSEHLLGQLEVPVTPVVLGAFKVKGGSLRDEEKGEKCSEAPRQRWSSVRIKGGSTKSLLLENGGPQTMASKGQITKEVFIQD